MTGGGATVGVGTVKTGVVLALAEVVFVSEVATSFDSGSGAVSLDFHFHTIRAIAIATAPPIQISRRTRRLKHEASRAGSP